MSNTNYNSIEGILFYYCRTFQSAQIFVKAGEFHLSATNTVMLTGVVALRERHKKPRSFMDQLRKDFNWTCHKEANSYTCKYVFKYELITIVKVSQQCKKKKACQKRKKKAWIVLSKWYEHLGEIVKKQFYSANEHPFIGLINISKTEYN